MILGSRRLSQISPQMPQIVFNCGFRLDVIVNANFIRNEKNSRSLICVIRETFFYMRLHLLKKPINDFGFSQIVADFTTDAANYF
jgi:hypothetical protein